MWPSLPTRCLPNRLIDTLKNGSNPSSRQLHVFSGATDKLWFLNWQLPDNHPLADKLIIVALNSIRKRPMLLIYFAIFQLD
jgi:hypothetical protein